MLVLGAIYALAPTDDWMRRASTDAQPASHSETRAVVAAARAEAGLQDPFFTLAMHEPKAGTFAGDLSELAQHICAEHCPQDTIEAPSIEAPSMADVSDIAGTAATIAVAQAVQAAS